MKYVKRDKTTENLLITLPELAKQWHPTKNGELKSEHVTQGMATKVWWVCKKGHEWESVIYARAAGSGCPHCKNELQTSFPEQAIYFYSKKLFQSTKNRYKFKYNKKKYEVDVYIPELNLAIEYDGHHHKKTKEKDEIKNKIINTLGMKLIRVRCAGLPVLEAYGSIVFYDKKANVKTLKGTLINIMNYIKKNFQLTKDKLENLSKVDKFDFEEDYPEIMKLINFDIIENSLLKTHPEVAKEWDYEQNINLRPENFTSTNPRKVFWKCENGHSWLYSIYDRTRDDFNCGCPYCSGKRVTEDNSLKNNPKLLEEWDYEKNKLNPIDLHLYSNKRAWWKCKKGHSWNTSINSRSGLNTNCPYCSNQKACEDNCLATTSPNMLECWDYEKNSLTPFELTSGSNKKVWWLCSDYKHSWYGSPNHFKTRKCPYCAKKIPSKEFNLLTLYPKIAQYWHPTLNGNLTPVDVLPKGLIKYWWMCAKCGKAMNAGIKDKCRRGNVNCGSCATKGIKKTHR